MPLRRGWYVFVAVGVLALGALGVIVTLGRGDEASAVDVRGVMRYDGIDREYLLQVRIMANMSPNDWLHCSPDEPTPVLHIHGVEDEHIPIDDATAPDGGQAPAVADVIARWAEINGTTSVETSRLGTSTTATYHRGARDDNEVWFYRIDGVEHELPDPDTGTDTPRLVAEFSA